MQGEEQFKPRAHTQNDNTICEADNDFSRKKQNNIHIICVHGGSEQMNERERKVIRN
jgi:hypothetical protein